MKLDKDSFDVIIGMTVLMVGLISVVLLFIHNRFVSWPLAGLFFLFLLFVIWFHRVPSRESKGDVNSVLAVADGKVVIVEKAFEKEFLKKECIQVSIYMNFFDVHANFWPISGEVSYCKYHPGKYLLAFKPKAAEENEHYSTCLHNEYGDVFYKQIAGTFARRIVSYSKEGLEVEQGKQMGIIKFGSRIDMFLPLDADIKVKVGDLTRACETLIAEFN
jgi:phosphatidylserine decarboxylase